MNFILPQNLGYGSFITSIPDDTKEIYFINIDYNDKEKYNIVCEFLYFKNNFWYGISFEGLGLYSEYEFNEPPNLEYYKNIKDVIIQL